MRNEKVGVVLLFAVMVSVIVHKRHSNEPENYVSPDKATAAQFIAVVLPPPPALMNSMARSDAGTALKPEKSSDYSASSREGIPVKPMRPQSAKPGTSPAVRPLSIAKDSNKPRKTSIADSIGRTSGRSEKNNIGEKLLARLETGEGPHIEIAWPAQARDRQRLFRIFHNCVGVRLARLQGKRITTVEADAAYGGFSGYVRVINGATTLDEQALLRNLDHPGIPVRLFPRHFDERLLAGLARLTAGSLQGVQRIHGNYTFRENALILASVTIDGRPVPGKILLVDIRHCAGRDELTY